MLVFIPSLGSFNQDKPDKILIRVLLCEKNQSLLTVNGQYCSAVICQSCCDL